MSTTEPRRIVAEYCPGCGETHYPARTGAAEYCRTCQYYGRDRAAQQEETVTEDCHRCRHWTPAQRKWHHCIHCDGTGQVPAQQEESADYQHCERCDDRVYTLSSGGLCDGCVEEEST